MAPLATLRELEVLDGVGDVHVSPGRRPAASSRARSARPPPAARGMLRCRGWPRSRSAAARSGPRCGRRDRSGVPRHAVAAVRAARPGARMLGDAEGRDAQPGAELQGARHGDGGSRGARRGGGAHGVRERRQSRAGAGVQRLASRSGRHGRGSENRQPAEAAPDRRLRRGRAPRRRGHRGRPAAGAGDRARRMAPTWSRTAWTLRPARAPPRSGSRSPATIRGSMSCSWPSAAERWPAAWATQCARSPSTWR